MTPDEQKLLHEKYAGHKDAHGFAHDRTRLASGEPLAYVIGTQPFLSLTIHLDSNPLIPRPETEWWVEQMLATHQSSKRALDLCAGSGAIGCAMLAALPNAYVSFVEIDPAHKTTIWKNVRANGLAEHHVDIRIDDLFAPFAHDERFDLIAANPPYIPKRRALDESVTNHEPALALFSGPDGLDLIRRIASALPQHLTSQGTAYIECDSLTAESARRLFEDQGLHTRIHTDQYDRPRVLVVSWT